MPCGARVLGAALLVGIVGTTSARGDVVLWANGPLVNLPGGGAGGAHASTLQTSLGLQTLGYAGVASNPPGLTRSTQVGDDFVVSDPRGWQVTKITLFACDAGGSTAALPMALRIFTSAPWTGWTPVLYSNTVLSSTPAGVYRVTDVDPLSSAYPVMATTLAANVSLPPGRYWLGWGPATLARPSPFLPPVTVAGQTVTGDARVNTVDCDELATCTSTWADARDAGTNGWQGFPFVIWGTPESRVKGNLDGLASPELLFRNVNPASPDYGRAKAWFMDGTTRTGEASLSPDPGPGLALEGSDDFDTAGAPANGPDGRSDLVFRDTATGAVQFWLMNGTSRVGAALPLTGGAVLPANWRLAATGDFDGDARPDLVWRNVTSQKIVVWRMDGGRKLGNIVPVPDHAADANWEIVAALDYNHDGWRDLLWYNVTSGKLVTWYLDAAVQRLSGQFVSPPNAGDANWKVVAGGDYSGAALPPLDANDVVWRNETSGRQVVWHLDFASTRVAAGFTSPDANAPALDWIVAGPR